MRVVDGKPVAEHSEIFGVRYASGDVHECDSEADARLQGEFYNAEVVKAEVFVTEWQPA